MHLLCQHFGLGNETHLQYALSIGCTQRLLLLEYPSAILEAVVTLVVGLLKRNFRAL